MGEIIEPFFFFKNMIDLIFAHRTAIFYVIIINIYIYQFISMTERSRLEQKIKKKKKYREIERECVNGTARQKET